MEEKTWHLSDGEDPAFIDGIEKSTIELSHIYERINSKKLTVEEANITEDWNISDIILDLYEVKEILGEGAFGKVYKVYHRGWNSYLAVKTLHSHLVSDEEHKKAFIKECQGWVNLGLHPNIVSCYYVRELGGLPRIFLEYIDGGTLASVKKKKELKEILDYSIQCLDGLIFAHNKGLIHRDIKPLNCLLTAGGDLKITDFGIASGLAGFDGTENSVIENPAGTPAYMPPEQWNRGNSGPWSDIYSFGIMLYELCCRKRPFDEGHEPVVVLKARHLTIEPEDPRNINKNIPENLSTFILKCLAKKPEERYKNCEDARSELVKIYESVASRPYSRKKPQEGRLLADGLNNRAVSMIDLGKKKEAENILDEALRIEPSHPQSLYNRGLLMWRSGRLTDEELIRQMEEAGKINSRGYMIPYLTSLIHMERGNSSEAVNLLKKALSMAGDRDKNEIEKTLQKAIEQKESSLKVFRRHTGWVNSVCISSDEKTGLSGSQDLTLNLWNLSDGTCIRTMKGHTNFITSVSISSDGTKGLSGSRDKTIRLWDLKSGTCIRTFEGHKGPVNSVNISSDGTLAISGGTDKIIYVWDIKSGNLITELEGHSDSVESVCFSPDTCYALSGSKDKTVRLWDLKSGKSVHTMEGHKNRINAVSISSDGNFALSGSGSETGSKDNTIRLWDLNNGQCINIFRGHSNFISSLSISRDGRFVFSGSEDRTVRFWDRDTGQCIRTIVSSTGISSVSMSPSGKLALMGSRKFSSMSPEDTPVHLWKPEHGSQGTFQIVQPQSSLKAMEDSVKFDECLKEGEECFKKGFYREMFQAIDRARNIPGYEESKDALDLKYKASIKGIRYGLNGAWFLRNFEGHKNRVTSITGDDRFILSGSHDKTIALWDMEKGCVIKTLEGHTRSVTSICISSDGVFAMSGSEDNTLRMWLIESGACINVFEGHKSGVTSVCMSPAWDYAISGSWDKTIRLWDTGGKCLKTFTGHTESVTSLCMASDGEFFLSASMDKTIRMWDIRKGTTTKILEGHSDSITSISISMDDKWLISGSRDGTMYLWDLEKGASIKTFKEHRGAITSVAFFHNGKFCISSGEDGKLLIWDIEKRRTVKALEGHTGAVLSIFITSEGRFVLSSGEEGIIKIYELDWDYEFHGKKPPFEDIRPYIKTFLHNRDCDSEENFQKFLITLGLCGYGWIGEEKVRKEVEKINSTFKKQTPLIEYITKPVLSKSDIEKFDSIIETKTNNFFNILKESLRKKKIILAGSVIVTFIIFILLANILFPGNRTEKLIEKLTSTDKETQEFAIKSLIKKGDSAVKPLIEALKDENPAKREMSAKTLGEIGSNVAIEPLIMLLGDLYPSVQQASMEALKKTGKPSVEPLIKELNNKSSSVRKNVLTILGDIRDPASVKPVIPLLIDDSSEVRIKAKEVIKTFDKDAVPCLIEGLDDKKPSIREISAEILGEIKDRRSVEPLILKLNDKDRSVREKSLKAIINTGDDSVEILIKYLNNKDRDIRKNVIFATGETGSRRAVKPLSLMIKDKDSEIRKYTAEALGKTADTGAAEPLLDMFFYDKDEHVKESALNALRVKTIAEASIPLILRYREEEIKKIAVSLKDELTAPLIEKLGHDTQDRIKAIKILGFTGNNLCINPLIELLKDKNPKVRKQVLESLAMFYREPFAVKAVKNSVKDSDIEIRNSAISLLKEMVNNCIKSLSDHNDTAIWEQDVRAIGEAGDITAIKPLIDFVRNRISAYDRSDFASEALERMGQPAVRPLIELLEYGRNDAKICAIKALKKIKDRESAEPLMKVFYNYQGEEVRINILEALGEIGEPASVKMLIETLKGYGGAGIRLRVAAAEALGKTGSADAIKPLEDTGNNVKESVELRDAARKALGQIKS